MSPSDETPGEYWDSCLFIHFLDKQDKNKANVVYEGLKRAQDGKVLIVVSSLVLAEVRPHDGTKYVYPEAKDNDEIEQLFTTNRAYLRVVAVTRPISLRSR